MVAKPDCLRVIVKEPEVGPGETLILPMTISALLGAIDQIGGAPTTRRVVGGTHFEHPEGGDAVVPPGYVLYEIVATCFPTLGDITGRIGTKSSQ